jgi:hypothetical protein
MLTNGEIIGACLEKMPVVGQETSFVELNNQQLRKLKDLVNNNCQSVEFLNKIKEIKSSCQWMENYLNFQEQIINQKKKMDTKVMENLIQKSESVKIGKETMDHIDDEINFITMSPKDGEYERSGLEHI